MSFSLYPPPIHTISILHLHILIRKLRALPLGHMSRGLMFTQVRRVDAALEVAYQAHGGQRRVSGEPYVEHPLAVTLVLAHLRMDGGLGRCAADHTVLSFRCSPSPMPRSTPHLSGLHAQVS
jgi:hypothetical protein